jgi:adenylate cyclase
MADESTTTMALSHQSRVQERRGTRNLHLIRAGMGIALAGLILASAPAEADAVARAWAERGLWLCLGMSGSALAILTYLRIGEPPRWLAFLPPPIDVGAVMLMALALGGASSPVTVLFFLILGVNGLMLRHGPMLFTAFCVSAAHLALDRLDTSPLPRFEWGLYLLAYWLTALTTAGIIRTSQVLTKEALDHQEARNNVLRTFGQHVSPQVVDALLAQGESTKTMVRHVSVMFLDIRGFTTLSESRPPQEVVTLLNDLFSFMIEEVNRHEGIINKFLGDGFMAVFGAPISSGEDARNSVAAAQAILRRLQERIDAGTLPPIRLGIGIHTGPAVTGSVGSEHRKEYTLIGDVVNVASRVESMCKELNSQLLVTATVWELLPPGTASVQVHQDVAVRGRQETVTVIQLA